MSRQSPVLPSRPDPPGSNLASEPRSTRTTIAWKMIMAVTGIVFLLFVLLHMYGNLKAFAGHDAYNDYAEHLRTLGEPMLPYSGFLWVLRAVLAIALALHVGAAVKLTLRARRARTVRYRAKKSLASTLSARTMRWGGLALLLFVIWHLINFTVGKVNVTGGPTNDPFNLLVDSFSTWWLTVIYLLAMLALGMHLRHGVWSAAQTLGATNNSRARRNARLGGIAAAVVIAGGFALVPIFILAGVITKRA
jgi:succinate dehydrogenase / fumarate reductase, cytochrome b subunit